MTTEQTLSEVAGEVIKHHPQVIFTGSYYAKYEQGKFQVVNHTLPEYKVYAFYPFIKPLILFQFLMRSAKRQEDMDMLNGC